MSQAEEPPETYIETNIEPCQETGIPETSLDKIIESLGTSLEKGLTTGHLETNLGQAIEPLETNLEDHKATESLETSLRTFQGTGIDKGDKQREVTALKTEGDKIKMEIGRGRPAMGREDHEKVARSPYVMGGLL